MPSTVPVLAGAPRPARAGSARVATRPSDRARGILRVDPGTAGVILRAVPAGGGGDLA
jgi:hypothetical protein